MSNLLSRTPTSYDDRIYSDEWRNWRDPDIPQWLDPVGWLIDRHQNTPVAAKPAIVCNDDAVTYAELAGQVARYATALAGVGLAPEQRLLLFGTDSLDYVTLWLASVRLGAVPVVISDLYKAKNLAYFLTDTAVRLLFIDAEQLPKLIDIADELPPSLTTILVRGDVPAGLAARFPGRAVVALQSALSAGGAPIAPHQRHANDVTYMFYSGGTTGTAKGITHLAHDFVLVPERHGHFWEYAADDVVFATSKKYFTHGLWPGLLIPLYWGATIVLDRRPPTPEVVLATLTERKVSKLITVPTVLKNMIEVMMQAKQATRFPALRLVISASEKMPPEMFERFYDLTGVEIFDFDRQLGDHLRMDFQPPQGVQARQPRQAGVRLHNPAGLRRRRGRDRTGRAGRSLGQEPHGLLLLLAQIRQVVRDLRRRVGAHRRQSLHSTKTASSGSAAATTTCSRSRACGCRRSISRRR